MKSRRISAETVAEGPPTLSVHLVRTLSKTTLQIKRTMRFNRGPGVEQIWSIPTETV